MLSFSGCFTVMLWCDMTSLHEYSLCQSIDWSWENLRGTRISINLSHKIADKVCEAVTDTMKQKPQASPLSVSLFFSHASLCFFFHYMMNGRCYVAWVHSSVCASVLACCMHRCLHASTLPFCRPLPRCCNSCSPFIIVAQKNTTRVLVPICRRLTQPQTPD